MHIVEPTRAYTSHAKRAGTSHEASSADTTANPPVSPKRAPRSRNRSTPLNSGEKSASFISDVLALLVPASSRSVPDRHAGEWGRSTLRRHAMPCKFQSVCMSASCILTWQDSFCVDSLDRDGGDDEHH